MVQAGITVDKDLISLFNDKFKMSGNKDPPFDYILATIENDRVQIVKSPPFGSSQSEEGIDLESDVPASYQSLKKALIEATYGYVFYFCKWIGADGERAKVIGLTYISDDSCPKGMKMVMASTKDNLHKACPPDVKFQVNDVTDLKYKDILSEVKKITK